MKIQDYGLWSHLHFKDRKAPEWRPGNWYYLVQYPEYENQKISYVKLYRNGRILILPGSVNKGKI